MQPASLRSPGLGNGIRHFHARHPRHDGHTSRRRPGHNPVHFPGTDGVAEVIAGFLTDGAVDRSVRDGLDAMDVTVAICALLGTTGPDDSGARARRLLDLFIGSLGDQGE